MKLNPLTNTVLSFAVLALSALVPGHAQQPTSGGTPNRPAIVKFQLLNQTLPVDGSFSTVFTPTVSGLFRASLYLEPLQTPSTALICPTVLYTNDSGQQQVRYPATASNQVFSCTDQLTDISDVFTFRAQANIPIVVQLLNRQGSTGTVYNLYIAIERL